MEKTFEEKLWQDLVSLQNLQRNLLKSEKFTEEDFEEVPAEESFNEHDLTRRELREGKLNYPNK